MIVKKIKVKDNPSQSLLLFFAGWGMDEHPFMEYLPTDRDCMICYDYRSPAFDESLLTPYRRIRVVAWSMGVWAASRILSGRQMPVTESIAINGTPFPVDDERGIAVSVFRGTLKGLNEHTLQKFRRRMCGSKETLDHFMKHPPRRTVEDLRQELEQIDRHSSTSDSPSLEVWHKVYIGLHDKIFLPSHQQKAWEGNHTMMAECEHYPSALWKELFNPTNPDK